MVTIYLSDECIIVHNGNSGDEYFLDYKSGTAAIVDAIEFALNTDGAEYKVKHMDEYEDY